MYSTVHARHAGSTVLLGGCHGRHQQAAKQLAAHGSAAGVPRCQYIQYITADDGQAVPDTVPVSSGVGVTDPRKMLLEKCMNAPQNVRKCAAAGLSRNAGEMHPTF